MNYIAAIVLFWIGTRVHGLMRWFCMFVSLVVATDGMILIWLYVRLLK